MFLENECDRSSQSGLCHRVCRYDPCGLWSEGPRLKDVIDDRADMIPEAGYLSDNDDHIRRQARNEQGETLPEVSSHLSDRFQSSCFPLFRQPQ